VEWKTGLANVQGLAIKMSVEVDSDVNHITLKETSFRMSFKNNNSHFGEKTVSLNRLKN